MASRRLLPALLVALVLLTACVAVSPVTAEGGRGKDGEKDEGGRGKSESERSSPSLGRFARAESLAGKPHGMYVAFNTSPLGVQNYTVGNVTVFSAKALRGAANDGAPRVDVEGMHTRIRGQHYVFRAHDSPNGDARFSADEGYVISLAPGLNVTKVRDAVQVTLGDDFRATLWGDDLTLTGNLLTGKGNVHFLLNAKKGKFDHARDAIDAAKVDGRIGAEVIVKPDANGTLQESVISYGNVTVDTLPRVDNLTFLIDGKHGDPRVLVLQVDPALFGNLSLNELEFLFDDRTFRPADSLTDVLDPDNDGLEPEYYVVPGSRENGTLQLIVSIPHYSVHAVTIQGFGTTVPLQTVSVVVGVLVGVGFVVLATVALFRRPRA